MKGSVETIMYGAKHICVFHIDKRRKMGSLYAAKGLLTLLPYDFKVDLLSILKLSFFSPCDGCVRPRPIFNILTTYKSRNFKLVQAMTDLKNIFSGGQNKINEI